MRYTYLLLLIAAFAVNQDTYAQGYYADALRFSQYQFGSTARLKGLASAQTAVGGDISSIGGNPAGLGLFTRSEFSLTTEIMQYSSKGSYFGESMNASRGKVNLNNLGAVFFVRMGKPRGQDLKTGVISLNFGIGYNKTNDFGNKLMFTAPNTQSSVANFYADLANGYSGALVDGSLEDAADKANLIIPSGGNYVSATNADRVQDEVIIRNGSQSELNLSAGINISNKFYIGTSIGLLGLKYSSDNTFTENGTLSYTDANGNYSENYNNNYYQRFEAKGSGFNMKLGVIFRPNQYFRIGATAQSPNWYTIDDSYSESTSTNLTDNPRFQDQRVTSETADYDLTYGLRTPAKFSLGASLFQNKIGFLTGEIELVDYSSIELESKDYTPNQFNDDNRFIVNNYKNATNYKIGAEVKATPTLFVRAGYSLTDSPIENSNQDLDIQTYSIGGGYRFGNINIDLAYQSSSANSQISPYTLNTGISPVASFKTTRSGVFLTVGTRF
ncbi:outer membrane protein transport protein [Pedobacter sp. P351]|uniref:OmpP1/FadL family transporter n=1 Tax=Pedobacter superstes TaxID=3133441 RepID=UPI0030A4852E